MLNKKPTIKYLRPFGAPCLVQIPVEKRGPGSKLSPRALEGRFVGYTGTTHMFRVYISSQRKVDTYRQVQFISSNDTSSLDVYIPSDVILSDAPPPIIPTATSQTPPSHSALNVPNQPSTPSHERMPGSFSPEATSRQSMKLPELTYRVTELNSDNEDSDSERVSSQLFSEVQRRITPPPQPSLSQPPLAPSSKKKDKRPASYNPRSYTSEHPEAAPSRPVRTLKAPKQYEDIDWDSKRKESGKANVVQGSSTNKLAIESIDKDK